MGAFIEVEQGVEGLIHVSEMSWTRKVRHPSQLLSIGDMIEAIVLNMDISRKRISLGMKQVAPNPWDVIEEKYPVGTTIEGKIKNITDFGAFYSELMKELTVLCTYLIFPGPKDKAPF